MGHGSVRGRREGGSTHEAWVSEGEGGSTHEAWVSEGEEGGREYTWGMGQ